MSTISVDCFARNNQWATYTNDLNPNTLAEYHLDVRDFLRQLIEGEIAADLVIFDPPFSPHQLKDSYEEAGFKFRAEDAHRTMKWGDERRIIHRILRDSGVVLSFGWNTFGMQSCGLSGYVIEEILLVCHGPGTPDTICMAERKVDGQLELF